MKKLVIFVLTWLVIAGQVTKFLLPGKALAGVVVTQDY